MQPTFLLCAEGVLREPVRYLSLYFNANRQEFHNLLQQARLMGDWENCLRFFLTGVHGTAEQAAVTARQLMKLAADDQQRVQSPGRAPTGRITIFIRFALAKTEVSWLMWHKVATLPGAVFLLI